LVTAPSVELPSLSGIRAIGNPRGLRPSLYEGMVPEDPDAPHVAGRTLKWLKVKIPK
jgi:hypothetical protein